MHSGSAAARHGCENFALLEFSGEEGEVIKVRELGVITHYTISYRSSERLD